MRNVFELRGKGAVKRPLPMAVEIDPYGGDPIEIPTSLGVLHIDALPFFNDEGSGLFPVLLLGKRVPQILSVILLKA